MRIAGPHVFMDNTRRLVPTVFFQRVVPWRFHKIWGDDNGRFVVIGVKHELPNGWAMDASATLGYGDIEYTISNTLIHR